MYRVEKALIPKDEGYEPRYLVTKDYECMDVVNRWININSFNSYLTGKRYAQVLVGYFKYLETLKLSYEQVTNKSVIDGFIRYLMYGDETKIPIEGVKSIDAVKYNIGVIKNFYIWLEDEKIIEQVPMGTVQKSSNNRYANKKFLYGQIYQFEFNKSLVTKLRGRQKRTYRKWLTKDQVEKIGQQFTCDRDRCIFLISYNTGARIGEILGIKMNEYDSNERKLEIRRNTVNENESLAKTLERDLYISQELCEEIDNYIIGERSDIEMETGWSDYMFLTSKGANKGKPVKYHNILKAFKNAGERAGFKREEIITHSGRSTRTQQLIELAIEYPEIGISDSLIQDEMGWKSLDTIKHYRKPVASRLRKKVTDKITEIERIKDNENRRRVCDIIAEIEGQMP